MKLQRFLRGFFCAISGAAAQGVVSQLGGFSEQVQPVQLAAGQPDALSIFLAQDPASLPISSAQSLPPPVYVPPSPAPAPVMAPVLQVAPAALPMVPAGPAPAAARPKGMLTLRSLRVASTGPAGSKITFGMDSEFSMGTDSAGNFLIQQVSAPQPLMNLDSRNVLHLGSPRVEVQSLSAGGISVRGVAQWQLVYSDDFSADGAGWSRPVTTKCGGISMLGGYCKFSAGEAKKTFSGLPPHKQLRVVAKYHFIDAWIGETGWMKLNVGDNGCDTPVWSEQHKQYETKNGVNLCGGNAPEGKFSAPVDVTVPDRKSVV